MKCPECKNESVVLEHQPQDDADEVVFTGDCDICYCMFTVTYSDPVEEVEEHGTTYGT